MTTVGNIGCGFVGGALKDWLAHDNKDVKVVVCDSPKCMNNGISKALDTLLAPLHELNVGFRGYVEHN